MRSLTVAQRSKPQRINFMKGKCPRNKTRINLCDQLFKKSRHNALADPKVLDAFSASVPMQPCLPSKIIMMISICIYIYVLYIYIPVIHSRISMIICICPPIPVMLHSYVKFSQGIIQHLFINQRLASASEELSAFPWVKRKGWSGQQGSCWRSVKMDTL